MSCGCNNTTTDTGYVTANKTPIIDGLIDKCSGRPLHPITDTDAVETKYNKTLTEVLEELINLGGSGITGKYVKDVAYNDGTITITYSDLSKTTYLVSATLTDEDVAALKELLNKNVITDIKSGNNIIVSRNGSTVTVGTNVKLINLGRGLLAVNVSNSQMTIELIPTYFNKMITASQESSLSEGYYMEYNQFNYLIGDTNFDGKVNTSDLCILKEYLLGHGLDDDLIVKSTVSSSSLSLVGDPVAGGKTTVNILYNAKESLNNVSDIFFTLTLGNTATALQSISIGAALSGYKITYNPVENNIYRVLCEAPSGKTINLSTNAILASVIAVTTSTEVQELEIKIDDISIAVVDLNETTNKVQVESYTMASDTLLFSVNSATKIDDYIATQGSVTSPSYVPVSIDTPIDATISEATKTEISANNALINVPLDLRVRLLAAVCDVNNNKQVDTSDITALILLILTDTKKIGTFEVSARSLIYINADNSKSYPIPVEGIPYVNKENGSLWTYFANTGWISNTVVSTDE